MRLQPEVQLPALCAPRQGADHQGGRPHLPPRPAGRLAAADPHRCGPLWRVTAADVWHQVWPPPRASRCAVHPAERLGVLSRVSAQVLTAIVRVCTGHSIRHHLLAAYRRSMLQVMLAQHTRKGCSRGRAGVAQLAACSPLVQVRSGRRGLHPAFAPSWRLRAGPVCHSGCSVAGTGVLPCTAQLRMLTSSVPLQKLMLQDEAWARLRECLRCAGSAAHVLPSVHAGCAL